MSPSRRHAEAVSHAVVAIPSPRVASSSPRSRVRARTNPLPEEVQPQVDWLRWYLTDEEDMGQSCDQADEIQSLASCLDQLCQERQWVSTYVGKDNFFAWVKEEPLVRVSPDVYLLDNPPRSLPDSWQTWRAGHKPPRFAVEIVSQDWQKDYDESPRKYAMLGAQELVIFDAQAPVIKRRNSRRVPLQLWRRNDEDQFARIYEGPGPIYSEQLKAWMVVHRDQPLPRLRIARDKAGTDFVSTAQEAAQIAEQARRDAERARLRAEQDRQAEHEARLHAEERLRLLEQELERMRSQQAN